MTFTITERALVQIKKSFSTATSETMESNEKIVQLLKILRIGVKKSGCSGFKYYIDFDKQFNESEDFVLQNVDNEILIITKKSMLNMVNDVNLDYIKQGINSIFKFSNPNAIAECGCGESFKF